MTLLLACGWPAALLLGGWALALRMRLEAVAGAEHELRGPLAALSLATATLGRRPGMRDIALALQGQVERQRAALVDLAAARRGRLSAARGEPAPELPLEAEVRAAVAGWSQVAAALGRGLQLEWEAGGARAAIERGRLAQSLGNVLSNALEHGGGTIAVRARRAEEGVRIDVVDGGRTGAPQGAGDEAAGAGGAGPGPHGGSVVAGDEAAGIGDVGSAAREGSVVAGGGVAGFGDGGPGLRKRPADRGRPGRRERLANAAAPLLPFRPGSGRGRGLAIAARAIEEAGGRLTLQRDGGGTRATIELPVTGDDQPQDGEGAAPPAPGT